MSRYNFIVVGAGCFGAVFAHFVARLGKKVLVVDKDDHIGGACYTENWDGINVHKFGAHIVHCNDDRTWNVLNRFVPFNRYTHHVKVARNGRMWSFPMNMMMFHQLWGVTTPDEARKKLEEVRIPISHPANLEEHCLSQAGEEVYELFIKHYTKKQWKLDPKELPTSIIKRLPIRLTYDDMYFSDRHSGIPIGGYTRFFEGILDGIETKLGVDFINEKSTLTKLLESDGKIVYSGRTDALYAYDEGELPYRNLRFEHERLEIPDYQGTSVVNYTGPEVDFTRIIEHKHFEHGKQEHTIVTREYPSEYDRNNVPYYPINTIENDSLAKRYNARAESDGFLIGGRLGRYLYLDSNQVIAQAIVSVERHFGVKIDDHGDVICP
jgi:UDP-galactopyranose mutase